jgi:hypothetical protein
MNDLYTKTVLSIIAAALLALVTQNAIRPSRANHRNLRKSKFAAPSIAPTWC